ncbi:iron-containing redox enzyme family protein [Alphaproteobacteria bacterium]|nr:iron-containing redox enzyme family protein [Alphaproteobacteria bacterium]
MLRSPEVFRSEILDVVGKTMWEKPHALTIFYDKYMSYEGAKVFALEHCVFAKHFPRWFGNIIGNCPHLEARRYMIENMYVEEVTDPTVERGHYETMVDFAVALGFDGNFVRNFKGALYTRMAIAYWDGASRTKPWLEAFAAIGGLEASKNREVAKRYDAERFTDRRRFQDLDLPQEALAHWGSADEADLSEGGHANETVNILTRYATSEDTQNGVLASLEESLQIARYRYDQIGKRSIEVSKK